MVRASRTRRWPARSAGSCASTRRAARSRRSGSRAGPSARPARGSSAVGLVDHRGIRHVHRRGEVQEHAHRRPHPHRVARARVVVGRRRERVEALDPRLADRLPQRLQVAVHVHEHGHLPLVEHAAELVVERHAVRRKYVSPMVGAVMLSGNTMYGRMGERTTTANTSRMIRVISRDHPGHQVRPVHQVRAQVFERDPLDPELLVGRAGHGDVRQAVVAHLAVVGFETLVVGQDDHVAQVREEHVVVGPLDDVVLLDRAGPVGRLEERLLDQRALRRVEGGAPAAQAVALELLGDEPAVRGLEPVRVRSSAVCPFDSCRAPARSPRSAPRSVRTG